jgi:hypothetical protein
VVRRITIQRSLGELVVRIEQDNLLTEKHRLLGGDWDGLRATLLRQGCAERQVLEVTEILETQSTVTITVTPER